VPWSGTPISTPICTGVNNTWFFSQVLTETGGVAVSLMLVKNFIDNSSTSSDAPSSIRVPAGGSFNLGTRQFCFPAGIQHTIQSTFIGTDANGRPVSFTAPVVTLLAKP
jgi:hypothetical protein